MIGLGPPEILLLACVGFPMFLATIVVLLAAIRYLSRRSRQEREPAPVAQALSHQDVLRTRYFLRSPANAMHTCPRCQAALAPDAPEGLCPACLMAGGLEGNSLPPTSSGHGTPAGAGSVDAAALADAFPNLEILELLGQGGMGTVYKVRQKNLDRMAALKVIPPQAALDPAFSERFAREARALARLNHANIVTVYDQGQSGGFYFLLMEYIDGANLRQLMRSERIAPREALAIVPQICDALQYAHDQGIVHRDIKPENVLIDRTGRVKIADFGLAKLLGTSPADFTLTHTQQVMGTPRYMAPEQIERPSEVDHRADIYSLGVVLYEMLTGELPIGRFAPPSQKVELDVRLDEIVLRTLEKEPARRYQQASEIRTEIESVGHVAAPRAVLAPVAAAAQARAIAQTQALARQAATPPMPIVLGVAIGMVLGMLMMGAGIALAVAPFFVPWQLDVWPFFGAGIGTLIGGAGSFFGSYNSYRQLAGAVDLMNSPEITWFDYMLVAYVTLGVLVLVPGVAGLVDDPSEEHVYPMLLIGGIMAFQAMLGMLWRWGARAKAIVAGGGKLCSPAQQAWYTVQPAFLPAVVVPTLLFAAVWLVLFLNFRFLSGHWPPPVQHTMMRTPDGVHRVMTIRGQEQLALSAVLAMVGLCTTLFVFLGLIFWRMVGPRQAVPGGQLAVAAPLGHPAWAIVVVIASFATFLLPWVRLSLDPVVRDSDFVVKVSETPLNGYDLRQMTGMPQEERYTTLGYKNVGGAAAAILAGAGAVLAAGLAYRQPQVRRMYGIGAVGVAFLAALILAAFVHQIGERQEALMLDAVTQRGLARSFPSDPSAPAAILAEYIDIAPGPGLYLTAAMTALLLLVGATQWGWSTVDDAAASGAGDAAGLEKPPKWVTSSDRELALAQVRGPGMGLIVSGVLGLAPPILLCVAIPISWTVLMPVQTYETHEQVGSAVVIPLPVAHVGISPPVLLAQVSAPPLQATPTWGVLLLSIVGLLMFLSVPGAILMILGGLKMRQLRGYGLANLAAIIALLPLGPQWLVSLPMGIWALAVLGRPEVKGAFE